MAHACRISSQKILSYTEVSQPTGSLNCSSGLIPLGRLHLRPLQRRFHLLGLTNRGNSSSGHVCHSPQHASSSVHVCSSGASSTGNRCLVTGLAGEVNEHVATVSPAQQNHSEAQDHSDGQGDTHRPPGGRHNCGFHIYFACVWTTHPSFHTVETCCHNRVISQAASHTICTHGGSCAALPSSRIFKGGI